MEILFGIIGFSAVVYFATIVTKFYLKLKKEIMPPIPKIDFGRVCRGCGGVNNRRIGFANIQDSAARARYWERSHYCDKCVRKIK